MTQFLSFLIAGIALGAQYALIVLGFVVIYRASGVLSFVQGGMVLLGCYLAYSLHVSAGLPFAIAVLGAMVATAIFATLVEAIILRRLVGQPQFAAIMATLGISIVLGEAVVSIWGPDNLNLNDPWGIETVHIASVPVQVSALWTIALAGAVLLAFFAIFRFSRIGLAMRATASDREAALAQGISPRVVFGVAWAIAGAVAALAGITAGAGVAQVQPQLSALAFVAFPAMVLGGLDSPGGAVIGGLVVGIAQQLTAGYQPDLLPFLGAGFQSVMPYVVMVVVLLVRPAGLFGSKEIRRA
jgi:branched-chain amino acid transport system permease protein